MLGDIHDENYKKREALMKNNRYIVDKAIKEYLDWKTIDRVITLYKKNETQW